MARERQREVDFLNLVSDLTSELELTTLLSRVVSEATRMLDCDRTTLFLNDEKTGELVSYVVDKLELTEIRFPNHLGIAGTAFTSGQSIRIPYAYADLRFNPAFDKQSGYFTRCLLCVPIFNKEGRTIGVTQSLNKRGGPFTAEDESRLRAFTAQIASALENAKLFSDVHAMKNYNAAMLESMSNGVITFDEEGRANTCNAAGTRILRPGEEEVLGGIESVATVLFSDIRSFTTLAEQLGAHPTVTLLNDYFGRMVDCISQQGGMLDKFIGDAIMAVFGLPVPGEEDEDRALRAAIAMIRSLWEWNREREQRGEPTLDMGVGRNTDSVVAGNIGSPKRMDYTIIGDGVNLASRLESACKHYGGRIILSEFTHAKLKGVYRLREIDRVIVKGKTKPVAVFECLDYHDANSFPNLM